MKKYLLGYLILLSLISFAGCNSKDNLDAATEETIEPVTPVTIVTMSTGAMKEFVELNATSVFLQKWIIKSNVTGYLQKANVQLNKFVGMGEVIFSVKTKEAQSIGNSINILDSSFKFSGVNSIRSNGTGFISEINHQAGDYVQDGEQLAVITDTKSFVFLMDLPYEMRPFIAGKSSVELELPDGEKLPALLSGNIPVMDSISQTQRIILKTNAKQLIPENLIAKVRLIKKSNEHANYIPKAAILSDETQSVFWVMKMMNDSTAVKTEIKKGIEAGDHVEIVEPVFDPQDKIVVSGNFGLADTAKVKIISSNKENKK